MPPPKKSAKKAAKKSTSKHSPHNAARDARRTFEHLGRVQSIASLAGSKHDVIHTLTSLADIAFRSRRYKESADLLRAAEHLCFAAIVESGGSRLSESLVEAIQDEFDDLLDRAEEHGEAGDAPAAVRKIYAQMTEEAASAMRRKAYRAALELARGAEALTHVGPLDAKLPGAVEQTKKLPVRP